MTRARWLPTAAQQRAHDQAVRQARSAYRAEAWAQIRRSPGQRVENDDGLSIFMDPAHMIPPKPKKKPGLWQKLKELFR